MFIHGKKEICLLTSKSNFKLRIYSTVQTLYIFKPFTSHHYKYPSRMRFPNAGDNMAEFTDFNTQCCPKIRLCGWQKASHVLHPCCLRSLLWWF